MDGIFPRTISTSVNVGKVQGGRLTVMAMDSYIRSGHFGCSGGRIDVKVILGRGETWRLRGPGWKGGIVNKSWTWGCDIFYRWG